MLSELFSFSRSALSYLAYSKKDGKIKYKPFRYVLETTYNCNLKCPFCYVGSDRQKKELSTNEWKSIISQIPFYGFISISGGEPLIRSDFLDILRYSANKTLGKTNVYTNGALLNDAMIEELVKINFLLCNISLDGYGQKHDQIRQKDGLFDLVVSNIENLVSKRRFSLPMIDIKTVVLDNNLDDLPKLYKLCKDLKCNFFTLSFLRNNSLKQNPELKEEFSKMFLIDEYPIKPYFDLEHFKSVYEELLSLKKEYKIPIKFTPQVNLDGNFAQINKFFNSNDRKVAELYKPCSVANSSVFINPEGNMYPCLSINMGSVKDNKLMNVLNNKKYCDFRRALDSQKVFNSCQLCCDLVVKNDL